MGASPSRVASGTFSPCQPCPCGSSGPGDRQMLTLGSQCAGCCLSSPSQTASCLSSPPSCLGRDRPSYPTEPRGMFQPPPLPPLARGAPSWGRISNLALSSFSCSSPMAFALSTYMNHAGIRSREPRAAGASEKAQSLPDRDKWLPFFPKTKKVGGLLCSRTRIL